MEQLGLFDRPAKPKRARKPKKTKAAPIVIAQAALPTLDAYAAQQLAVARDYAACEPEKWRLSAIDECLVRAVAALVGWLTGASWESATQCLVDVPDDEANGPPSFARVGCPACGVGPGLPCKRGRRPSVGAGETGESMADCFPGEWETCHGVRFGAETALDFLEALDRGELTPKQAADAKKTYAPHVAWLLGGDANVCFPKLRASKRRAADSDDDLEGRSAA